MLFLSRGEGTGRELAGGMLAGWGAFNLIEGVVDHHLLGLHHVRPGHAWQTGFDLLFIAVGAALLAGGWALAQAGRRGRDKIPA